MISAMTAIAIIDHFRSLTLGLENFELEATMAVTLSHESK